MKTIDETVLAGYNAGIEKNRLREGIGLIEFTRTKEILREQLPPVPAVIYDIGGGYGEYAWWLTSLGYKVHLFDLSETNINMSNDLSGEYPSCKLECAEVCDARSVPRPDKSADAVLFMGPLYHIVEHDERISALRECYRVLKDDGLLFSAALTPYSVLLHLITVYRDERRKKSIALEKPDVIKMIERELIDGCHINLERKVLNGLGTSHLHTAKALKNELSESGFADTVVHGVMGGAWLVQNLDELWKDEVSRNALMNTVRLLDTHEEVIGLSGHLLAVSRKEI